MAVSHMTVSQYKLFRRYHLQNIDNNAIEESLIIKLIYRSWMLKLGS